MASALENITECPICLVRFREPRAFPCDHSVCKHCIPGLSNRDTVKCPICRRIYRTSQLRVDFKMVQIIDALKENERRKRPASIKVNGKCEICQTKAISFWCEECQQWMCDGCHIAHRRIPACRNHHMTPISAMNEEATKKIEENQGKLRDCMVDHQIIIRAVQDTIRQRNDQQTLSLQESDQLRNEVLKEINDYFDSLDKLLIKFIHKRVACLNQQKEQLDARYNKLKECVISTNVILKDNPKTLAFKESALVQEAEQLLKSYATPDVRINNNILRLHKGPNWDVRKVAGLRKEEKPQTNSKDLIYHNRISSRETINHVSHTRDSRRPRTSHAQHGESDSLRFERSRTNINPERSLESRRPPLPPRPNTSIATHREEHTRRESLDYLPSSSLNHENSRTCSVQ